MPMPFIYKQFAVQIIQQPDRVLIIYTAPSTDVRRVRLNDRDPGAAHSVLVRGFGRPL